MVEQIHKYTFTLKYKYYFFTITIILGLVFKATFNNISVISWLSVLLVEETRIPGKKH
jgi:hypothetical protein